MGPWYGPRTPGHKSWFRAMPYWAPEMQSVQRAPQARMGGKVLKSSTAFPYPTIPQDLSFDVCHCSFVAQPVLS